MIIGGLQKLTLLDYPEHVACSVFLKGCNFCCPFCYNSSLIDADDKLGFIDEQEFFNFLNKRVDELSDKISNSESLNCKVVGVYTPDGIERLSQDSAIEEAKNYGYDLVITCSF